MRDARDAHKYTHREVDIRLQTRTHTAKLHSPEEKKVTFRRYVHAIRIFTFKSKILSCTSVVGNTSTFFTQWISTYIDLFCIRFSHFTFSVYSVFD